MQVMISSGTACRVTQPFVEVKRQEPRARQLIRQHSKVLGAQVGGQADDTDYRFCDIDDMNMHPTRPCDMPVIS